MFCIIINELSVMLPVGICEHEYLKKQNVIFNVKAYAHITQAPKDISGCLDYTKITEYVKSWENEVHVDLLETLLFKLLAFCFNDSMIEKVEIEILKTEILKEVKNIGVGISMTKAEYVEL